MKAETQLDRRARRSRQAIKSAFVALVLEKGYDAVTVMDVAERADYNRGTFYKHFMGKEELLKEIRDDFLAAVSDALLDPYPGLERIEADRIFPSTLLLFELIEKRKDEFKALLTADKGMGIELMNALRRSMKDDMRIELEHREPPVDYEIMLSYQLSATVGVIMYWAETNFKYSARYMAEQLFALNRNKMKSIEFTHKPE
ncbi:TetR/AcrR family transcriptional regulator [Paenibacillus thailandensis]|uniref:TetR/AcrR family transcriptional regulator n=1 Tax=Paenibacillus thailandensis TaxID=393250 RepID=A0ABW5QYB6_9BACL